ncbi:uncharacterized protein LOC132902036 [Amyelois transitella]|uniref:uncharacterized protein LOC132902036 n=1 Tax=Amyelois transitella TaxID=680683 RepID=UPI00299011B0|nr:uncharacterized protein LOC132902036 [Amyelois transitella]
MNLQPENNTKSNLNFVSYNCKSVTRSVDAIRELCKTADLVALQETWLLPHDISYLGTIDTEFAYCGKSAVDTSAGILRGRPYGGLAILWRKSVFANVSIVECASERIMAIKILINSQQFLVFSVYMPTVSDDNLPEFTERLSEISAVVDECGAEYVYVLGDFNAQHSTVFGKELASFCDEQQWVCADWHFLGISSNTYTYVSDIHGTTSWLDHLIVTKVANETISNVKVLYDVFWSDHFPIYIEIKCDFIKTVSEIGSNCPVNKIIWGNRKPHQIDVYNEICNDRLRNIDFPLELKKCFHNKCHNLMHRILIDNLYNEIVQVLFDASTLSYESINKNRRKCIIGWNKHVRHAHSEARNSFNNWVFCNKPRSGPIYYDMCETRRVFKSKLKWCQNNQENIKMNILAAHHTSKRFDKFWKQTNRLNHLSSLPASVGGVSEPAAVANMFKEQFQVSSPLGPTRPNSLSSDGQDRQVYLHFSSTEVAAVVKCMTRGKSPGHDSLSIEHLQHAGAHLSRVLSMLYTLCVGHSYLPNELMMTLVVPVPKNKTGDRSDKNNYRPISLATILAKVLDGLLEKQLNKYISLHDAQFGFRPGLSTESAVLCLKHTVRYYTDRKTPVYACFLDLSKAFDLVSYDKLWSKLEETDIPSEVTEIFKYWYGNQRNYVKWAGSLSDEYRMECGVRQGGLTSPTLFNLYMDQLILELSSTMLGCSVGGTSFNNISYADDMVLLSPSVSALRRLVSVCERYAETHGLRYNATKSELLMFKAKGRAYSVVPPVSLAGTPLKRVTQFKYLGHWVTDTLSDDLDMARERRALSVRCNMLARRFAKCTKSVKLTLFKAYCQVFYTCSLWVDYTQKAHSALRVQYNNGLRALLGLPKHCSASGMFAEARVDTFQAIVRKRVASLMRRVDASSNSLLTVIAGRVDGPILKHWTNIHLNKLLT